MAASATTDTRFTQIEYPPLSDYNYDDPAIPGPVSQVQERLWAHFREQVDHLEGDNFRALVNVAITWGRTPPYVRLLLMHSNEDVRRQALVLFLIHRDGDSVIAEWRQDAQRRQAALQRAQAARAALEDGTAAARRAEEARMATLPKAVTVTTPAKDVTTADGHASTVLSRDEVAIELAEVWTGLTKTMKTKLKKTKPELYRRVSQPLPADADPRQVKQMAGAVRALRKWVSAYRTAAATARGRSQQARQRPAGNNAGNRTPRTARQASSATTASASKPTGINRVGKTAKDRQKGRTTKPAKAA